MISVLRGLAHIRMKILCYERVMKDAAGQSVFCSIFRSTVGLKYYLWRITVP